MAVPTTHRNEHLVSPSDDQHPSPPPTDRLSTFIATYPTPLYYSRPFSDDELFVFWSPTVGSHENDPPSDNPRSVSDTIKSAFIELQHHYPSDVLIQFWAPENPGSISTYDQPFGLNNLESNRNKHRLCSLRYQYVIDANKPDHNLDIEIVSGAPSNAFVNKMAEVVMDLRVRDLSNPLVLSALECGFVSSFVMPVCYPSQSCCVGVVECFAKSYDDLLGVFMGLVDALQVVGMSTFHGQEYLPYKTIGGLQYAMDEIEVALVKVCESYDLSLAQVSIAYGDENLVSLEDKHTKPMSSLKLVAPSVHEKDEDKWLFIDHCGSCDMVPLRIGEGLASKALQNYEHHLCKNIYEITNIDQLPSTNINTKLSCLVICLRSVHTDNLDYVFEFLWPRYRNYSTVIEALISTLEMRLPNFKFACGDELHVINFGNSSKSALQDFMTYERDLHVKRKCVRYGIDNWQRPKKVKRKADTHDNNRAIKAQYQGNMVQCRFPPSLTTFKAVEKEIAMKFTLIVGQFEMRYRDEYADLISMVADDDMRDCLKSKTSAIPLIYVENIDPMD